MSSFLFLHFCDEALRLLGLYFSAFILSKFSSGGFLPLLHKPPQGSHAGPTGLVWGCTGVVPLPSFQNRTRVRTGPSLDFTAFFSQPFSVGARQTVVPDGNLPLREWAGSCKAASRFSQFHPMSTLLWVAFR